MSEDIAPKGRQKKKANFTKSKGSSISLAHKKFDPDLPISPVSKKDKLGFRAVASDLAKTLLAQSHSSGWVMSIEGEWGSGKSSLVNLLADELKKYQEAPEIVRFEPWIVGNRDGMLGELMSDLAKAVDAIGTQYNGIEQKVTRSTAKIKAQILEYGSRLSRGSVSVLKLGSILGVPGAEIGAKIAEGVGNVTDLMKTDNSLPEIKRKLTEGLQKLPRRVVVVIDDLDRLEPLEATEIMRLIKAVADFPNVIYILCFDP